MSRTLLPPTRPIEMPGAFISRSAATITNGLSNTMSSWQEVVTSTSARVAFIMVDLVTSTASGRAVGMLMDVGIGGAGSEVTIISGMQVGMRGGSAGFAAPLPCDIPPGTRIAVRTQINQPDIPATSPVYVSLFAAQAGAQPRGSVNKYTVDPVAPSTSLGVAVTVDNTWVEVTASTPMPYRMLAVNIGGGGDTGFGAGSMSWDLGIGPSGAEVVVASGLLSTSTTESFVPITGLPWACGLFPRGTRIAYRSNAAATNGHTVNVIGVP